MGGCGSVQHRGEDSRRAEPHIGGKYRLAQDETLWQSRDLGVELCTLRKGAVVTLLSLDESDLAYIAQPQAEHPSGWLRLKDSARRWTIEETAEASSWEVPGRYFLNAPRMLQRGVSTDSDSLLELEVGQEILLLQLSLSPSEDEAPLHLRGKVVTASFDVGWLSLEMPDGVPQIQTTNLLGKAIIEVLKRFEERTGVKQESYRRGKPLPWSAGGKYRVLQEANLHDRPEKTGDILGELLPGGLVSVEEVLVGGSSEAVPWARVVLEGPPGEQESTGWVACIGKDSSDLIDFRDQLEAGRLLEQLKLGLPLKRKAPGPPPRASRRDVPTPPPSDTYTSCPSKSPTEEAPPLDAVKEHLLHQLNSVPEDLPLNMVEAGLDPDEEAVFECCMCQSNRQDPFSRQSGQQSREAPVLSVDKENEMDLRIWLRSVFLRHNPSRLATVDHLIAQFADREGELIMAISKKYGVQAPAELLL